MLSITVIIIMLIFNVSHRHMVFIIPDTLRELFRNQKGASQHIKL